MQISLMEADMLQTVTFLKQVIAYRPYYKKSRLGFFIPYKYDENSDFYSQTNRIRSIFNKINSSMPLNIKLNQDDCSIGNQQAIIISMETWLKCICSFKKYNLLLVNDYSECKDLLYRCEKICSKFDRRSSMDDDLERYISSLCMNVNFSIKDLKKLYLIYMQEMEELQLFSIYTYLYNNKTTPRYFLPFSYTLNMLSTNYMVRIDEVDGNSKWEISVGCVRDCIKKYDISSLIDTDILLISYGKKLKNAQKIEKPCKENKYTYTVENVKTAVIPDKWNWLSNRKSTSNLLLRLEILSDIYRQYAMYGYNVDLINRISLKYSNLNIKLSQDTFFVIYPFYDSMFYIANESYSKSFLNNIYYDKILNEDGKLGMCYQF